MAQTDVSPMACGGWQFRRVDNQAMCRRGAASLAVIDTDVANAIGNARTQSMSSFELQTPSLSALPLPSLVDQLVTRHIHTAL